MSAPSTEPATAIFGSLTRNSTATPTPGSDDRPIHVGDLLLCEVVEVGCYDAIETPTGEQVTVDAGSVIVGVAGNRESSTSLSGKSPSGVLAAGAELDLLGKGGLVGTCTEAPDRLGGPTRLRFLATLVGPDGDRLAVEDRTGPTPRWGIPMVVVIGSAALVGKTRMTCRIIRSLCRSGSTVAACKLSGTGRVCDVLAYRAAGAAYAADFVDAALPTTYGWADAVVVDAARRVVGLCTAEEPDVVVIELGGDAAGGGNRAILRDADLRRATRGTVLVGSDVFSVSGLVGYLDDNGWRSRTWVAPFRFRNNRVTSESLEGLVDADVLTTDESLDEALGSAGLSSAGGRLPPSSRPRSRAAPTPSM